MSDQAEAADELTQAQAAVEAAWGKLNELHQGLPECEHVRAWRTDLQDAHQAHQTALRARDQAYRAKYPDGQPEGGKAIR